MKSISATGRYPCLRHSLISEILEPRVLLSSYDAAADFSTTANPSGAWYYGVRSTEFGDFAQFPVATTLDFSSGVTGWNENSGSPPYVGINTTGAEVDSEGITLPTGVLAMHPGGNGEYADLRFIVPQSGPTTVTYNFTGIDTNGTTTDVHILYNGSSMRDGNINGYQASVNGTLSLPDGTAGDLIDFIVGYGSNGTFDSDCTSLSAQVSTNVSQNRLVFSHQPREGDIDDPEVLQVKMVDAHGELVRHATDGVELSLNPPPGVSTTINGGSTVYAAFHNGYASFSPQSLVYIEAPGTYTLNAVAADSAGDVTPFVTSAVSKPFVVHGRHIFFLKQPGLVGADELMSFSIELEDYKNRRVEDSGYLTLQLVNAATGVAVFTDGQFTNEADGTITDTYTNADEQLAYSTPGTYYLLVSQPSLNNITTSKQSNKFQITPDHLVFMRQPSAAAVNAPIPFTVKLENAKNQGVTLSEFDPLIVSFSLGSFEADQNLDTDPVHDFSGFYDNATSTENALGLRNPGTFQLIALIFEPEGNSDDGIFAPATSKKFFVFAD